MWRFSFSFFAAILHFLIFSFVFNVVQDWLFPKMLDCCVMCVGNVGLEAYYLRPKMIFLFDKCSWLTPQHPQGAKKSPLIVLKSNSKCCNFCIRCPNSIKLVGKVEYTSLVCVVKFSDQSKTYWVCESHSKFTGSIWFHHTAFWWLQLRGLVSFSSNVRFQ